ncbi:replication initiator protein A [Caulobacter endophyticus]|uniref:Plasmid replication initiator protein n=1 Tax=Caulobacter endophyticus TaxID=2172652 RepID=A0A2T9JY11_9CAUL|nr:replication initiator protein A [Caulobacter endophyticus]PVM88606.1 plasmid replication initiator protein [Caulobacter endophyticus]
MTAPKDRNNQFDLFIPLMRDVALKDQRETMERPFFSLQKRKRLKPIEYRSGDGEVAVKVEAVPAYGMATIWDADILIWAASALNRIKAEGRNDVPRSLKVTAYDLLRSIQRDTGGKDYNDLKAALDRLQTTTISTSIRAKKGRDRRFSWLDSWEVEVDPVTEKPIALKITLSDWVYEGIINEKSVLTMHPDYFHLSGGLERAIYRIARKHAGDQDEGWTCRVSLLHEKTGSDSVPKEFNRMMRKIVEANELPEYDLSYVTAGDGSPAVRFIRRSAVERVQIQAELEAEDATRRRREREDRRADEVDGLLDPWAKRRVT